MKLENEFTIKDICDNGMVISKSSKQTIWNWARWGWINCINKGTKERAKYYFKQEHIDELNDKLRNGFIFPTPKREIKQPKGV